jgi:hypothetical protein
MLFKKLQYHCSYKGGVPCITSGYFTDATVLLIMLDVFSTREWNYYTIGLDRAVNSRAVAVELGWLDGGYYGTTINEFTFNAEKPDYERLWGTCEPYKTGPLIAPGIIN